MRFQGVDATVAQNYEAGDWATEGIITNPVANQVLADTGQLAEGIYDFDLYWNAGMYTGGYVEHRNAANDGNIKQHLLTVAVGLMYLRFPIRGRKVATNERLRAISYANYTGLVQVSIIWVRRA